MQHTETGTQRKGKNVWAGKGLVQMYECLEGPRVLPKQTWVHSPECESTDNWVVVKESTEFIAGRQARRMGSSCSKTQTPQWLSEKGF